MQLPPRDISTIRLPRHAGDDGWKHCKRSTQHRTRHAQHQDSKNVRRLRYGPSRDLGQAERRISYIKKRVPHKNTAPFAYLAKKGSISESKRSGSLVPPALCCFPAPARLSSTAAPPFVSPQAHALAGLFFIGSQQAEQRARAPAVASLRGASSPSCPQFQRHQKRLRQRPVTR